MSDSTQHAGPGAGLPYLLKQQSLIANLGARALQGWETPRLFDGALQGASEIFLADFAEVLELRNDGTELALVASSGWDPQLVGECLFDVSPGSQSAFVLASREPVIVKDLNLEVRFVRNEHFVSQGVTSGINAVIHGPDGPWGLVGAHTKRPLEFTDGDIEFFVTLASLLAAAILRSETNAILLQRLEEKKQELKHFEEFNSQLVSTISHEIRTPMNAIIGLSECLIAQPLSPDDLEMAEHIKLSADRLLSIVNDLLDFSRLSAGREPVDVTEFAVTDVIDQVVFLFGAEASKKGLTITTPDLTKHAALRIKTDEKKVAQILSNLLGNAIKFTEHGDIEVHLQHLRKSAQIKVSVRDHGIGMESKALSKIFLPFTQAEGSTSRKFGGTGLGLTICRRYVQLLGGEIGVESSPGAGSCFWFALPTEPAWCELPNDS